MKCPKCQTDNKEGAKFCLECGHKFEGKCPQCGYFLPPTAKFCDECGHQLSKPKEAPPITHPSPQSYTPKYLAEKILTSRAALEGERKQVTVLFADLKGSMELIAERDPEEARKLLDPVLERMMEAVHHYEGTVTHIMGDGIMALFGAPLAHEDHAVRACYAALRIQEAIRRHNEELRRAQGVEVQIRVGLNSGEVVVGSIGSDLHMDYTAVGHTTHLAARMEQLAAPGSIRFSSETQRLAEGFVEVKSLGPVPVKGLAEPVEVYEVTGGRPVRTRLQAAAARGLTRFVGRDAEVEQLRQALQKAGEGRGQVMAIMGEPGVGKSRLFHEFIYSHRTEGWLILEAASVSYGKATVYFPVIDLLKNYFKIQDRDDHREIRQKVIGKLLALDRTLEPTLPAFFALLDVPVEDPEWQAVHPPHRRQRTLDAMKRLLLRESQVQPLLVVFEDLHWIDSETQAVLDSLVESLPAARIFLLVNYRPEYRHAWGSKTYYTQVRIDPLPPKSAEELLEALLGTDTGLGPLKRLLVERTEGNPFFLEESVRTLVETKALVGERGAYGLARPLAGIQVPATVQAVLAARIDGLPPEEKRLVQTAAVIGKDVPFSLLQAIADQPEEGLRRGLTHLQAAEFLYETTLFPDLEYTFKHALTYEVAYGSLLQEHRRVLHARIVEAIERLHAERLTEHVERLGHHALRGQQWEKALTYFRQAGLKAAARSALPDARAWFEQALGVLKALPENRATLEQAFDIRLELWSVLSLVDEIRWALEHLREAEALAERLDDDHRRGRVCVLMTRIHVVLGELDEALASGTHALALAQKLGDLELRIFTTNVLGTAHYYRAEFEQAVELATDNLAALPADWVYKFLATGTPASVSDRCLLVRSLAQLGRFAEAARYEAEAIRLAESTHHAYTIGLAYYAAGTFHLLKGDWAKASSLLEHGLAVFRAGNVAILLRVHVASFAWALAQLGETSEALDRLREGEALVDRFAASGHAAYSAWAYHSLGRACLLLGRLDEARSLGDRAIESDPSHPGFAAHALHLLGDVATHPDRFDAASAEVHYRKALALAEPRGMRPLVAHCHLGLGRLHRRMGKRQEAEEHLATAATMYREMDMGFWLEKAEKEKLLLS